MNGKHTRRISGVGNRAAEAAEPVAGPHAGAVASERRPTQASFDRLMRTIDKKMDQAEKQIDSILERQARRRA